MDNGAKKFTNEMRCSAGQPLVLKIGLPIVLIIAGMTAYANSFKGPFIYDDGHSILENPHILHLWPLSEAMSAPPQATVAGRPVVSLTLALNYAVSGYSVWSYHLFNLLVHLLAGLTLYGIVRRTLLCERLKERFGDYAAVLAWAVAVVWLVHPIQTESVTYIIQRAESLMGFFYLLTLYSAIRVMGPNSSPLWLAASVICCGLGMGTKEVRATAPVLVLLYDRTFAAGSFIGAFRRRWGLYAGLAGTWVILAWSLWRGSRSDTVGFSMGIAVMDYALNQCRVIVHYLRMSVWPQGLCLDYGWPVEKNFWRLWPFVAVISGMSIVTVWGFIRNRLWSYPLLWFFVVLSPTSSFVPVADLAYEHRMYLPLAGLSALAVLGGYSLLRRFWWNKAAMKISLVSAVIVIGVLGVVTLRRNNDYRSVESIWRRALDVSPDNFRAHGSLGIALIPQGKIDEAMSHLCQALKLKPDDVAVSYNLGRIFQLQGKLDEAAKHYRQAIQAGPGFVKAYNNLGIVLSEQGKFDEAVEYFKQALHIKPDYAEAHYNLGAALKSQGRLDEAISHFGQAVKLKPDFAEAYFNLGSVFQSQGRLDEAKNCYRQVLQIDPNHTAAGEALRSLLGDTK